MTASTGLASELPNNVNNVNNGNKQKMSCIGNSAVYNARELLNCIVVNARSLVNKVDFLNLYMQSCSVDVAMFTESRLDDSIPNSFLISQNQYKCFRKDRDRSGGGVCIIVKSDIAVVPVKLPEKFHDLEIVAIDIIGCNIKCRIINVYRSPCSDITAVMDIVECLRILSAVTYPSTIVGDFNLPHINWNDLSAPSDRIYSPFIEFVNDRE